MSGLLQIWMERFQSEPRGACPACPERGRRELVEGLASRAPRGARGLKQEFPTGQNRVRRACCPEAGSWLAAARDLLAPLQRSAVVWAVLWIVLFGLGIGSSWAQLASPDQNEPEEGGLNESSLPKKGEKKPAGEVVPPPAGMSFSTRLDHTAVWVGDQFRYLIMVDYTPDYEFVLDNLTRETVNMDPFQVMDVGKKTAVLKNNNKRLFVDLTLANFGTGQTSMQIPQFTLYYFHKERRNAGPEQAAAESLTVPGPVIGLRSTLPPQASDIRDAITINSWERTRWILPAAGLGCLVLLVAGTGWELVLLVQRKKSRKGPDRRKAMEAIRARWVSAVPSDFSDSQTVMEFYNHSYQDLKEYLGYYLETPTMGLTAEDLQEEMQRLGANAELTEKSVKVLGTCEMARYAAQNGVKPNTEAAPGVAQNVREILSLSSKG